VRAVRGETHRLSWVGAGLQGQGLLAGPNVPQLNRAGAGGDEEMVPRGTRGLPNRDGYAAVGALARADIPETDSYGGVVPGARRDDRRGLAVRQEGDVPHWFRILAKSPAYPAGARIDHHHAATRPVGEALPVGCHRDAPGVLVALRHL